MCNNIIAFLRLYVYGYIFSIYNILAECYTGLAIY